MLFRSKEIGTPRDREILNLALTQDGRIWESAGVLEQGQGEYSYPAVIQTHDGKVHVTYTHERKRIRHVVLDPLQLRSQPLGPQNAGPEK